MRHPREDTGGILKSILRGAAKIVGCSAANLLVFDERERTARVLVGTMAANMMVLNELEDLLGSIADSTFPFDAIGDSSLVLKAWRTRTAQETDSLADLVDPMLFGRDMVGPAETLIGDIRFFLVPVMTGSVCPGILLFTKPGKAPFSPQQRELMVRYAQRVGEIIEQTGRQDMTTEGGTPESSAIIRFLVSRKGRVTGMSDGVVGPQNGAFEFMTRRMNDPIILPAPWMAEVIRNCLAVLDGNLQTPERFVPTIEHPEGLQYEHPHVAGYSAAIDVQIDRLTIVDEPHALVTMYESRTRPELGSHQLVRLALGETAPTILADPELAITSANDAAERLFGYEPGTMVGISASELLRDAGELEAMLDRKTLVLTAGYLEEGAFFKRNQGDTFPGTVEALLLIDDLGELVGYLIRTREQSSPLDPTAAGSVDRLMRRERLATMGELAAQLAHEIRNPLIAIGATMESLAEDVAPEDRLTLSHLQGEIARLDMLLRDYLSMAARHNATLVDVDVAGVVAEVIRLLGNSPRASGRTMTSEIPRGLTVKADPDALRHVFFNLVLNALEAVADNGHVVCRAVPGKDDVVINVDDDGTGLTENPRQCFEPFFSSKKNGTGLGLTVCRRIVEAHRGAITLRNREGGGCRASVVLPGGGAQ